MGVRLGSWGFFAVLLGLLPVMLGGFSAITRARETFEFEALFERGELLLVTAAVLGAALAELFSEHDIDLRATRFFAGCSASAVLLAASVWFADIAGALRDSVNTDPHAIASGSLVIFGLALVSGIACLVVAQRSEDAAKRREEQQ